MAEGRRTGAEQRAARAAGVQYARQDKPAAGGDGDGGNELVRHASGAYDEIDALVHAAAGPMPASLVYDLLGNLHALVGRLPVLLTQLDGGLQQTGADPRPAGARQVTQTLEAAGAVADELARRLADARSTVDDRQRAARLPGPPVDWRVSRTREP